MKTKVLWLLLVNLTLATAQVQVIPAQLYQKVVERGYETQEVVTRLANYYYILITRRKHLNTTKN